MRLEKCLKWNIQATRLKVHFWKWHIEWVTTTKDSEYSQESKEYTPVGSTKREWQLYIVMRLANYIFLLKDQPHFCFPIVPTTSIRTNKYNPLTLQQKLKYNRLSIISVNLTLERSLQPIKKSPAFQVSGAKQKRISS